MKPLSPAMRRAIELARGKNGTLHLHHFGGHWFGLISTVKVRGSTVKALVDRGLAEYTRWSNPAWIIANNHPIEVTLTAKALTVPPS
jgi:hypothetical protein